MKKTNGKFTLKSVCNSKVQNFTHEVQRKYDSTTNLNFQWLYKRFKKLLDHKTGLIICETCGIYVTFDGITIDHKIPKSLYFLYSGNIHNTENLQLICLACNSLKGQKPLREFLEELSQKNATIEIIRKNNKTRDVVAPRYPNIGIGYRLFGDKSEAKFVSERKNNKRSTKPHVVKSSSRGKRVELLPTHC